MSCSNTITDKRVAEAFWDQCHVQTFFFFLNQKCLILENFGVFWEWNSNSVSVAILHLPNKRYKCPEICKIFVPCGRCEEAQVLPSAELSELWKLPCITCRNWYKKVFPYYFLKRFREKSSNEDINGRSLYYFLE